MGCPFDVLASTDFLVPDRDAAVAAVQRALGFVEPKPRWSWGEPGQGFRVTFCRPNPSLLQSPTLVELIEAAELDPSRPLTDVVPNVAGLASLQGDRPLKTHGAPVASTEVEQLIDAVRTRGLRHWVQPSSDAYPFPRLWMGITADGLADYRQGGDGGLMLEVVHTATLGLPAAAFETPEPAAEAPDSGTMVRTATRGFLVADLDQSLDELANAFSWEPDLGPEDGENGSRRAVLGFRLPQSARLELVAPPPGQRRSCVPRPVGAGIWCVRIAVRDLAAKAEDLQARGTRFKEIRTGFESPELVLRVHREATPGCLFEFAPL